MTQTAPESEVGFLPDDLHGIQLVLLASGGRLFEIVYALTELEVADKLADGPLPIGELASRCGADESALQRLLRATAMLGIFAEGPIGVFRATPITESLRSDNPHGVLPLIRHNHLALTARPFMDVTHSVRTGESAFQKSMGATFNAYLEAHPDDDRFYDEFQSYWARAFVQEELDQWNLGRYETIADLGGGDGYFIAQALLRYPSMRVHLTDLPWMAKKAEAVFEEHGVADRATVIGADLLDDPVPTGCDAYFVKAVFMRLSDDQAERALLNIRAAIGRNHSALLIVDSVLKGGNEWDHGKLLDIDMLVLHGGRKRTLEDWQRLLARTGFELVSVPNFHWDLLECRPV